MFLEERHQAILDIIKNEGRISIGAIQERFNVSVDTARRDLRILEKNGLLKRTRGGAIPLPRIGQSTPVKMQYHSNKDITNIYPNYDAIAAKAVEYIMPNDVVYITSGSIGFLMLKYLPIDYEFTVITNSIDNACILRKYENIKTYIIGGQMRPNGRMVDSMAQELVRSMNFDLSFLTGAGFTPDFGISNGTPETVVFQKIIANNTKRNIALFPSHKIGIKAFLKDVDMTKLDILITDSDVLEDDVSKFREKGLEVVIVGE